MAKLFTIELCYLATIAYHLYQLQTAPALYAGAGSFAHASQLQASDSARALHVQGLHHIASADAAECSVTAGRLVGC